eukprot:scaffold2671_cov252-Pinguiococcus_pyrenoidosus.AAC.15
MALSCECACLAITPAKRGAARRGRRADNATPCEGAVRHEMSESGESREASVDSGRRTADMSDALHAERTSMVAC